jgi:hypothetical protein
MLLFNFIIVALEAVRRESLFITNRVVSGQPPTAKFKQAEVLQMAEEHIRRNLWPIIR